MKLLGHFGASAGACSVLAGVAQACPVCMAADPKTAGTYLGMTLMMSALPLGLFGGLIYWLKRRYSPRPAVFRPAMQAQSSPELVARQSI